MSLEDLEKRLKVLEDIEQIRQLKTRYADYCDINAIPDRAYDPDKIASCFTEDAYFESSILGRTLKGRKEISESFAKAAEIYSFSVHMMVNPVIEVDGDKAKGTWYIFMSSTIIDGNRAAWSSGRYNEEYARENGEWKISSWKMVSFFRTPFDEGWVKNRFA